MRNGFETKEKIEKAALQLFVEQGISETSIKDIAIKAGVSQGAMYIHFQSKEELAWSMFARHFSEIGTALRHLARQEETLEGKLRAMIHYAFELFDENWLLVAFVFFPRYHFVRKVTPEMGNPYMVVRTVAAEAMKNGEIPRRDPELAASMVLGAIVQVVDTKILGRINGNLAGLADSVAKACVGLLAADPEAEDRK